jgi:aspartate kinase
MARKGDRRSKPAAERPLEVWKFGGASLSDAAAVRRAVGMAREHRGPLVIVVSAMAGVTDLLLDGARRSLDGDPTPGLQVAAEFRRRHRAVVAAVTPPSHRKQLLGLVDEAAEEYCNLARAVAALRDLRERTSDTMSARGERVASAIVAAALSGTGRKSVAIDACQLVVTDGRFGNATPDISATRGRARRSLHPLLSKKTTPVVPGFIGAAPDGSLTTLGRGGSDLTATLLGRVLGARRVVLWKDVLGILTADPRLVPDARLIPQLHHREAAEVAYYGAKVLHPRALIPLAESTIVLNVRSFLSP